MPNIDERVVQMTFDNKQFEKNVSQSIKSLDDLKKALDLDKMSNSLKNVEKVTNTVSNSMSALEASVQKVAGVFTPFGNMAFNALNKISNAALDVGANLLKMSLGFENANLNIDVPGQKKYESYTKAVQTITNATGKSVATVSKTLDKLSKYTDETSYDFAEMVSSIGKFTSVGLDLERSEKAMEGIANWAAKSGAGKTEANRAMYNISQAMGTGAMKLIDWKSIENANMATKEFKETAIQTAVDLGVLTRKGDGTVAMMSQTSKGVKETTVDFKHFNETLQQGWLNSDVLMATLEKYGDTSTQFGLDAFHAAQEALTFTDAIDALKDAVSSGWMVSLKYIFGDLDEARKMWTGFANALIEFSDIFTSQRNELLKGWHELAGYSHAVEAASNIWQAFMNVVLGVKEAFEEVFPPLTKFQLADVTEQVAGFSEKLKNAFRVDTYTDVEKPVNEVLDVMTQTLEKGAKGKNVSFLKQILYKGGFSYTDFSDNDEFTRLTEIGVKNLQKKLGIEATGVWDSATAAAAKASGLFDNMDMVVGTLKNVTIETEKVNKEIDHTSDMLDNLEKGVKNSESVKYLQTQLMQAGYLQDKYGADGIFGPSTEAAVKKLQQALGVEVTGKWDDTTRAAASAAKTFTEVAEVEEEVRKKVEGVTQPMLNIQTVVRGVASTAKLAIEIGKAGIQVLVKALGIFKPLAEVLGRAILMASEFMTEMTESLMKSNIIEETSNNIIKWLSPIEKVINTVAEAFNWFLNILGGYDEWINNSPLQRMSEFFSVDVDGESLEFESVWMEKRKKNIGSFLEYLREALSKNPIWKTIFDIYDKIKEVVVLIYTTISKGLGRVYEALFGDDKNSKKKKKKSGIETFFNVILIAVTALAKGISFVIPIIAALFSVLFGAFEKYVLPIASNVGEVFTKIFSAFSDNKLSTITDFFEKIKEAILETDLGQKLKNIYENVENFFKKIVEKLKGIIPESVINWIKGAFATIKQIILDVGSVIGQMYDAFKEGKIKTISDFFAELGIAILSTPTGKKLYELSANVKAFFESLKETVEGKFGGVINFFKENIPKVTGFIKTFWDNIKEFFTWDPKLSFADNIKNKFEWLKAKLKTAIAGIMEVLGSLVEYIRLQFTVNEETGNLRIVDKLQELLTFLEPITSKLESIKNKIVNAIKGILGIDGEGTEGKETVFDKIKGFFKKISKIDWGKLAGPAIGAVALYAVISGSKAIKNMSKAFLGLADSFTGGKLIGKKDTIGDTALKIAGSILAIAAAIGILSVIPAKEALVGVGIFTLVLAEMVAAIILVSKFGKDGVTIGVQVLALAGSIAVAAIGILMMMNVLKSAIENGDGGYLALAGVVILGMLALMGLIAAGIAKVSKGKGSTNISGLLQMCIGVGVLVLAFGYLLNVIKENIENQAVLIWASAILGGMIVLIGGITIGLAAINPTGDVKIKGVLGMCIGIGVVVLAFGHLVNIVKENSAEDIDLATKLMIAIMVGIGAIGVAMGIVYKNILTGISSTIVILALAYAIKTIADAFTEDILKIQDVDIEVMKTFFNGISEVVAIMGTLALAFGAVPLAVLIKGVIGLAAFIAILSQVGHDAIDLMGSALWSISSKLKNASQMADEINFDSLKEMASYLEDSLPKMLAATAGLEVDEALDKVTKLSQFGGIFANYATSIGSMTEDKLTATDVAESLATSAVTIFNTLKNIGDSSEFSTSITELGAALRLYYREIAGIGKVDENGESLDVENLPKVNSQLISEAFSALAEAIPKDESILQINSFAKNGEHDLTQTALGIEAIGAALESYGDHIGNLKERKIRAANSVLTAFKSLYDTFTDKSLIVSLFEKWDFTDDESDKVTKFAENITEVGSALQNYITATENIDEGKIKTANGVISFVSGLNDSLPDKDGVLTGWLLGGHGSLSDFASNMGSLGDGLAQFANNTAGGDFTNVEQALNASERLGKVLGNLDKIGGLESWLSGSKSLSVLGEGLPEVGTKLVEFADATKGFSYSSVSQPLAAFQQVLKFATTVGETYWEDAKTGYGHNNLSDLGEGLKGLFMDLTDISSNLLGSGDNKTTALDGFIEFGNKISEAIAKGVYDKEYNEKVIGNSILDALSISKLAINGTEDSGINEKFKSVGDSILVWIGEGIGRSIESWRTVLGNQISTGPSKINEYKENYIESGRNIVDGLISGLVRMCTKFYNQLKDIAYYGSEKVDEKYSDYVETGKYLMQGLAAGIIRNSSLVTTAAANVARAAHNAANKATKVASPSKAFAWTGEMWDEGLVEGIGNSASDVIDSMTDMADESVGSVQDIFGNADISSDGIESYLQQMSKYGESLTGNIFQNGSIDEILNGSTDSLKNMLSGNLDSIFQNSNFEGLLDQAMGNMKTSLSNGFSNLFQDDGSIGTQAGNMLSGIWDSALNTLTGKISGGGDAKSVITSAISSMFSGVSGEMSDFTVKPVLDFENMSIGGSTAGDIASNIKGINENNATLLAATESANQAMGIKYNIAETYLDIMNQKMGIMIDRMESANERISQLGNEMAQMKLYLDGDKLVGGIEDRMYRNIDRKMARKAAMDARAR